MSDSAGNVTKKVRIRLRIDPKERFPEKLYDVVSDGRLLHWNASGTEIYVREKEYEETVMGMYPGFVQIPQFPNLRRLFREYGFDWRIKESKGAEIFQFAHPCFVYGQRHLLSEIQTRRKSYVGKIKFFSDIRDELSPDEEETPDKSHYRTRSKYKKKKKQQMNSSTCEDWNSTSEEFQNATLDESVVSIQEQDCDTTTVDKNEKCVKEKERVSSSSTNSRHSSLSKEIMSLFIKNEFTFDDFCAWMRLNQTNLTDHLDSNVNCNQGSFGASESASCLSPCHQCACCLFYNTRYEVLNKPCMVVVLDSSDEESV